MTDLDVYIGFADAMSKLQWSRAGYPSQIGTPAGKATQEEPKIEIIGARNQVVGVQIRLVADQDLVLTLDHANWLHALGFCPRVRLDIRFPDLPPGIVEHFAVGYVEGDDRQQWMETLDRTGYAEVPAYRPQAVYVRIRIPAGQQAGLYRGRVTAYAQSGFDDEEIIWTGAIRLQVINVTLPDVTEWSYHLDLWQHCTAIARLHRVPLWSDDHFSLIDKYYASLAELGQKAVSIIATEVPWSGQRCFRDRTYPSYLYEHAVIDVSRDHGGHLHFDYAKLDRQLALAEKHGIACEVEILGLLNIWVDQAFGFGQVAPDAPDAIRIRCYDQKTERMTYLRTAGELSAFIRALHDHMDEMGWLDRVRITADEPSELDAFNARLAFVQAAAPGFKYKVAINHFEFMQDAPPELVDAVPNLPLTCRDPDLTAALAKRLHQKGGKMLWYVCCGPPLPNTFIHSPLVETLLLGWMTFHLQLDGFLRWAFCLWPAAPWKRVSWRAPHWNAGDMFFVLPGQDGAPVETLRYEAMRTAAQDFELLKLAERTLAPNQARTVLKQAFARILRTNDIRAFADVYTARPETLYSLDPQDYQEARRIILEAIAQA
ncbi:MAG: DUF4091 domain-containing protein [Anaerolineae bacterium]|nr:DUF4091 domain-containing protein [Anaerolineae bacterium]